MPNRTAKFSSALLAGLLAGAFVTTASHGAPAEPEKCLAGPTGTAPQGGHWYYRVDRANKRNCWYIGDAREKAARPAAVSTAVAAEPASPPKNPTAQKAIADARAELPLPPPRIAPQAEPTGQRAVAPAPNGPEPGQRAISPVSNAPSVIGSRWPESSGVAPAAAALGNDAATATVPPQATPARAIDRVALAAADATPSKPTGSIQTLLIVIIGALALAGLIGSAIFRFGSTRWPGRRDVRVDRHAIWDSVAPSHRAYSDHDAPMPAGSLPRGTRAADDADRRVNEMLARLARSAAT